MKFIIQNKKNNKNIYDFIQLVYNDGKFDTIYELNFIIDLTNVVELALFKAGRMVLNVSQNIIKGAIKVKKTTISSSRDGTRVSLILDRAGNFYEISIVEGSL